MTETKTEPEAPRDAFEVLGDAYVRAVEADDANAVELSAAIDELWERIHGRCVRCNHPLPKRRAKRRRSRKAQRAKEQQQ
jgi:hypothetical protein